jgi:hypothetical protein
MMAAKANGPPALASVEMNADVIDGVAGQSAAHGHSALKLKCGL